MATGVDTTFPHDDSTALGLFRDYADKADSLTAQGAQVIVLPEKIALVSDQATSQVDALYSAVAARARANVVVGLDRGTLTKRFNEARLYSPGGTLAAIYDKHHMVPKFEDADQPGTTITVLDQPSGVWGMQICKDMDFPGLSRQYGARGVGLLFVPAWDFTLDAWLHGRMAVMRGVESGFTIVRASKQGLLTISDDRGRILAQQDAATVRFASLLATAPVRHEDTLYARWGDWFAWLNIAGFVVLLLSPTRKAGPGLIS
jgi:apolipoprotein N-acyltransferase